MPMVYSRITNPFMPNATPDKTNSPSPFYAPGELGCVFSDQNTGGVYLRAQLDSGATSATSVGAVVAGQLAYWKDRSKAIVTNDKNQCDQGPSAAVNRVAGIFQTAVSATPGVTGSDGNPVMYMCDLVLQKLAFPVQATGTILAGTYAIADTTANTARIISQATVTTAPVSQVIGVCTSGTITSGTTPVDVNIGFLD